LNYAAPIAIVAIAAFLLGSIPWGVVISKGVYKRDLRKVGSGNIGTTNAIRAVGKVGGYVVFLLDFAKGILSGVVAIAVAHYVGVDPYGAKILLAISFLACILGHMFTPWLKGKGGKGVAVGVGCMFVAMGPLIAVLELVLFAALVAITKYVSVGSIAAAGTVPLFAIWAYWGNVPAWAICSLAGILVVWAHRGNIARLRAGTELAIGHKGDKGDKGADGGVGAGGSGSSGAEDGNAAGSGDAK